MRPKFWLVVMSLGWMGCQAKEEEDASSTGEDSAAEEGTPKGPAPAELAALSSGECPDLTQSGTSTFLSNGIERQVRVILPSTLDEAEEGAPVVFMWHPLGATANQIVRYLGVEAWAEDNGVVVVVPSAEESNPFEWGFWNGGENDLALYDDLRTCLAENLNVDLYRFTSTGMSAGGLWTSFLATRRGTTLATVLAFSGGTDPVFQYQSPGWDMPVMLAYGGEDDTWGGGGITLNFYEATMSFAGSLAAEEHFLALCNHEGGHTIPPEAVDMSTAWLLSHRYGEASPFEAEGLGAFPDYCALYP